MKSLFPAFFLLNWLSGTIALPAIAQQSLAQVNSLKQSWDSPTLRVTLPTMTSQLEFSHDGESLLVAGATDQSADLWNLKTGTKLSTFPAPAGFAICDLTLSADGQFAAALLYSQVTQIATTKRQIKLQVWNLKTGKVQWASPIQDHIIQSEQFPLCQAQFSPDSQRLATSVSTVSDQSQVGVRLWDVPTGKLQAVTSSVVTAILQLSFSPDGSLLGFTTRIHQQSQLHLWNLRDRRLQANLKAVQDGYVLILLDFLFSPTQPTAIVYTTDGGIFYRLYRWRTQTGHLESSSELPLDRTDGLLAVSPDGETYVYGGEVTGYHIGNLRTAQEWRFPQELEPTQFPTKVVFSPDGQQMAVSTGVTISILQ